MDKNIASAASVVVFKELGMLQLEFERPELRKLVAEAGEAFSGITGDKRKWAYCGGGDPGQNPDRLKKSLRRFGLVIPLVVRPVGDGEYETVGGAQRLSVLRDLGMQSAPCVVLEADDINARLLAQALNRIQGEDDLGVKAQLLQEVLRRVPGTELLARLPETAQSLQALAALGQEDIAGYLRSWQQAQSARLKHLTFQGRVRAAADPGTGQGRYGPGPPSGKENRPALGQRPERVQQAF